MRNATDSDPHRYFLTSVGNALDVLVALGARDGAGVAELAAELGVSKTAAFRLLYTLKTKGFVDQDRGTSKYRLGYRVVALAARVKDRDLLGGPITPFLESLATDSGETANLGIREDLDVVHINTVNSSNLLRLDIKIGDREPLYSTALGKILLAHMERDELEVLLGRLNPRQLTPNTITHLPRLKAHLLTVLKRGYALDNEESYPGIRCIAVPVRDAPGRVFAALSLSAPISRFPRGRVPTLYRLLMRTAGAIHALLLQYSLPDSRMMESSQAPSHGPGETPLPSPGS